MVHSFYILNYKTLFFVIASTRGNLGFTSQSPGLLRVLAMTAAGFRNSSLKY